MTTTPVDQTHHKGRILATITHLSKSGGEKKEKTGKTLFLLWATQSSAFVWLDLHDKTPAGTVGGGVSTHQHGESSYITVFLLIHHTSTNLVLRVCFHSPNAD